MPARLRRGVAAFVLGFGLALAVPLVAHAAPEVSDPACAPEHLAGSGHETFELETRYVPPPLRGFPAACATKLIGEDFDDDGTGISAAYTLVYPDSGVTEMADILAAFEREGWITQGAVGALDDGSGQQGGLALTSEELRAADAATGLLFARARFGDARTGLDTIEISYADGVTYTNDPALTAPSLLVTVLLSEDFATTGFTDPSVLSDLRTIPQALPTPTGAAVIAGSSIMLMLVVGWPSALLNNVVGARYEALVRRLRALRHQRTPAAGEDPDEVALGSRIPRRAPGWLIWPGFAAAALIGACVDPAFGVNERSLRVVLTLFVSFVIFNLATWAIVRRVALRLQPESGPYLRLRWGSLAIVAIAVLAARLLEFQPGIIFGLVGGIAYAASLEASRSARVILAGSGFAFVLGLVAWTGYSVLAPVADQTPGNAALLIVVEFLAGVTIKGVSSLPLSLLPLGSLDGAKLFGWRRLVWGAAYALALAGFLLALVTVPAAWGEIPGDFVRWLLIFGGYALLALAIWITHVVLARRAARRSDAPEPAGEDPEAITLD